jgi:hypothetical protein
MYGCVRAAQRCVNWERAVLLFQTQARCGVLCRGVGCCCCGRRRNQVVRCLCGGWKHEGDADEGCVRARRAR